MSSTTNFATIPAVSDADRAQRLIDAGAFWGERITDNISNAALMPQPKAILMFADFSELIKTFALAFQQFACQSA